MAASILQDFAPIAESNANPNGYWGAITSSVDWCEINYHVSSYLCEFFNSFSSVAMVLVGVLGYFLQHDLLEARFVVAMCMISVVGMGSFAFHATLKHETQMLDEVPMLWNALSLLYIITENEHASTQDGFWFHYRRRCMVFYISISSLDQRFASILRVSRQLCNSRILLLIPGLSNESQVLERKSSHAYLIQLRILHFPNCPGVLAIGYKLLFNLAKFAVRNS